MRTRLIDPELVAGKHVDERLGWEPQRNFQDRIDRLERAETPARQRGGITIPWYRANIGASGDAAYLVRLGVPTSDSAWAMDAITAYMPAAGRVETILLWSSEARTAGTATARVRITTNGTSTDFDVPGCVLNATTTQTTGAYLPESTIRFASGSTLQLRVVTVSWTPTTADIGALVNVTWDL